MHVCMIYNVWCIYPYTYPWSLIMKHAWMYDPWPWWMYIWCICYWSWSMWPWCTYVWCIYPWCLILIHACMYVWAFTLSMYVWYMWLRCTYVWCISHDVWSWYMHAWCIYLCSSIIDPDTYVYYAHRDDLGPWSWNVPVCMMHLWFWSLILNVWCMKQCIFSMICVYMMLPESYMCDAQMYDAHCTNLHMILLCIYAVYMMRYFLGTDERTNKAILRVWFALP